MAKEPYSSDHEYIPHQICPRCSLHLAQDLCVCGWRRPRPDQLKKEQSVWPMRILAALVVGAVVYGLVTQLALK